MNERSRFRGRPQIRRRRLPFLLLLFVGSGCAALIYEIVWLQLLQLVIGSSAVSLGVLLGTFMGGMCLGSLLLPRIVSRGSIRCASTRCSNWASALIGLLVLFGHAARRAGLYVAIAGHGMPGILLRGVVCAVCLLPPTLLMGATLPAIARWVETTPEGVSWLGFFYGGNIAGAVFGCLLAGFYLLRVHDMATATYVAVALNVTVGIAASSLASLGCALRRRRTGSSDAAALRPRGAGAVYVVIALSGMSAWAPRWSGPACSRCMLGGTVYTFSLILAVFLIGLGIGSSLGRSWLARTAAAARCWASASCS